MEVIPGKCLKNFHNGELEIHLLTSENFHEALDVLHNSFYLNENICIATEMNLPETVAGRKELDSFVKYLSQDGVSLVCKHVPSGNKIVGVAINSIQNRDSLDDENDFLMSFQTDSMKSTIDWLTTMENKFDIFKNWNIDCKFEMVMIATLPQFQRRGIAKELSLCAIQLAKEMSKGLRNAHEILPQKNHNSKPKAIFSIFTSSNSQKLGKQIGYEFLETVPYTEFSYKGERYSDKIHPQYGACCILAAQKL